MAMIYLNNAATTYPKPPSVLEKTTEVLTAPPLSQYRSTVQLECEINIKEQCRKSLAKLFCIEEAERIFFTDGSTSALNAAILGFESNRHEIVITATEHNAVLRTVYDGLRKEIAEGRYKVTVVPCDSSGYIDKKVMKEVITEDTGLVIVNHCSNVTGAIQDISQIGEWARQKGACLLVDASQSAGSQYIDVNKMQIDMLAFTAHKGLYGISGCGGLYVRKGIVLRPRRFGGTGRDSKVLIPKTPFYEVGTDNIVGIAALNAGVEFVLKEGMEAIEKRQSKLMRILYQGLCQCEGIKVYADRQPEGTVLSFNVKGLSPMDVGYILYGSYHIVVRAGLHCSPLIHTYLGSLPEGTVRVSLSYMTTKAEIEALLQAVKEIAESVGRVE